MLNNSPVFPSIRVSDIKKARKFYEEKLGLVVIYEESGELLLEAGKKSRIYLYEGEKSKATHTLAVFYVDDIYKVIDELNLKGVKFEQYDFGKIKTDKAGIAKIGKKKGAWIKDPDGNILALSQIK